MKRYKTLKLLSSLLALLMLASAFAGCGGTADPLETVESGSEITSKTPDETTEKVETTVEQTTEEQTTEITEPEESDDMIPIENNMLVKALWTSALSYYYKNPYTQYEANAITIEDKAISGRSHWNVSSQAAEFDEYHYTVCSTFTSCVYKNAFDFDIIASNGLPYNTRDYESLTGPEVVYLKKPASSAEYQAISDEVKALLQPGDILVAYGNSGHAMLYLGDVLGDGKNYIIHCWGSHITNGVDKIESKGAIYLQTADELVFGPKNGTAPNWSLTNSVYAGKFVCVYRPFASDKFKAQITPEIQSRLDYEGICINKYLDITQYNSVKTGDKITLTVDIENNGKTEYKDLTVIEKLPAGAKLVSGELSQKVTVPAGKSISLKYVYEVTGKAGETVKVPQGKVDRIKTREISVTVGYEKLTESQTNGFYKLAKLIATKAETCGTQLAAVNDIYKAITGVDVGLPSTVEEYIDLCYKSAIKNTKTGLIRADVTDANRKLMAMNVRKMYGGMYNLIGDGSKYDRALEFRPEFFEPGDVLVTLTGSSTLAVKSETDVSVYIYLGNGKMLALNGESKTFSNDFNSTILTIIENNFYFVLRPSLVIDGLAKTDNSSKYEDVAEPQSTLLNTVQLQKLQALKGSFSAAGNMSYVEAVYKAIGLDVKTNGIQSTTFSGVMNKALFINNGTFFELRTAIPEGYENLTKMLVTYGGRQMIGGSVPKLADLIPGDVVATGILDGEKAFMSYVILVYQGNGNFLKMNTYREVSGGTMYNKGSDLSLDETSFNALLTDPLYTGFYVLRPMLMFN